MEERGLLRSPIGYSLRPANIGVIASLFFSHIAKNVNEQKRRSTVFRAEQSRRPLFPRDLDWFRSITKSAGQNKT